MNFQVTQPASKPASRPLSFLFPSIWSLWSPRIAGSPHPGAPRPNRRSVVCLAFTLLALHCLAYRSLTLLPGPARFFSKSRRRRRRGGGRGEGAPSAYGAPGRYGSAGISGAFGILGLPGSSVLNKHTPRLQGTKRNMTDFPTIPRPPDLIHSDG